MTTRGETSHNAIRNSLRNLERIHVYMHACINRPTYYRHIIHIYTYAHTCMHVEMYVVRMYCYLDLYSSVQSEIRVYIGLHIMCK